MNGVPDIVVHEQQPVEKVDNNDLRNLFAPLLSE